MDINFSKSFSLGDSNQYIVSPQDVHEIDKEKLNRNFLNFNRINSLYDKIFSIETAIKLLQEDHSHSSFNNYNTIMATLNDEEKTIINNFIYYILTDRKNTYINSILDAIDENNKNKDFQNEDKELFKVEEFDQDDVPESNYNTEEYPNILFKEEGEN